MEKTDTKRARKSEEPVVEKHGVADAPTSKKGKPKESSKEEELDFTNGSYLLEILKNVPPFGSLRFDDPIWSSLVVEGGSGSVDPKLLILCGPPGCGKSTIKQQLLIQNNITTYINIDPDEIRTILMQTGVRFVNKKDIVDDKIMSGVTNAYNKRICNEAQRQRLNIVFDTTGQNFGAISELTRIIEYTKIFTVIWASKETCIRRIIARNHELTGNPDGRIELPIDIAEQIYDGFMRPQTDKSNGTASMLLISKYKIIDKVDEVLLYNNDVSGENPILLFHKNRANVQSSNFPTFYNMDLITIDPYIVPTAAAGLGNPFNKPKKTRKKPRKKHTNKSNINKSRRKRVNK
jgi:adenylate kinase family enzyme